MNDVMTKRNSHFFAKSATCIKERWSGFCKYSDWLCFVLAVRCHNRTDI